MADLTHIQTASASHPFSDLGAFMHADGTFFRFCLPGANAVDVIALDGSVLSPVSYTHLTLPTTPYV